MADRRIVIGAMLATFAAAGCTVATPYATPGAPDACAQLGQYVSVGGTGGFNTLVNPDFTNALRATGRVRLYEHGNAVAAAISDSPPSDPYAILNAIERVFGESGPGEAELGWVGAGYFTLPASAYPGYYRYQYVSSGLRPNAANVDTPYKPPRAIHFTKTNVRRWKAYAQAGKSVGIASMAPIVAPNIPWQAGNPIFPPKRWEYYDFNSAFYDLARFEATYGEAIAFDTPSKLFLDGGSGAGYQRFIEQAIRWGNAHGVRTTVLVSPLSGHKGFAQDTKRFVRVLTLHHAVPSEWAVDDYENVDPNDAKAMGPDTTVDTTTNVALWLAKNAPVYVQGSRNGGADGGVVCRP